MPNLLSVLKTKEDFRRVANELDIASDIVADVCAALDTIAPFEASGRLPLALALLALACGTEQTACEDDPEYMRFRAITHTTIQASLEHSMEGYGEVMAGEPQAYGALNAVLIFFLQQYNAHREDASATEGVPEA